MVKSEIMSAPKRDKFAALAASHAGLRPAATATTEVGTGRRSGSSATNSVGGGGGGGGKLDALQKSHTMVKRDKFSAMASRAAAAAAAASSTAEPTPEQPPPPPMNGKIKEWTEKCEQREKLWKDLEEAEVHILDVMDYAQQTVECFARQAEGDTTTAGPTEIQKLSSQVQQCIRQLHDKLAPAAQFIQAYQPPERINKLYQVRVEEGLAVQKEKVLKGLVELEKQKNKTPRELTGNDDDDDDGTRKRKRQE